MVPAWDGACPLMPGRAWAAHHGRCVLPPTKPAAPAPLPLPPRSKEKRSLLLGWILVLAVRVEPQCCLEADSFQARRQQPRGREGRSRGPRPFSVPPLACPEPAHLPDAWVPPAGRMRRHGTWISPFSWPPPSPSRCWGCLAATPPLPHPPSSPSPRVPAPACSPHLLVLQCLADELKVRPGELVQRYRELGCVDVATTTTSPEGTRTRGHRVSLDTSRYPGSRYPWAWVGCRGGAAGVWPGARAAGCQRYVGRAWLGT